MAVGLEPPVVRNPLADPYPGPTPAIQSVPAPSAINVGTAERVACAVGGGLLAFFGLRSRSILGLSAAAVGGGLLYRGLTGHCSLYHRSGVNTAEEAATPRQYDQSVVVRRPALDCYLFWRHLNNAPRFMSQVRSVRIIDERHSHWECVTPLGKLVHWDAFLYEDVPGERLAWRTLPGAPVGMAGSVTFTPQPDLGLTVVKSEVRFGKQFSWSKSMVARLLGSAPDQQMARDLQRFKELLESGESVPDPVGFAHKPRWQKSRDPVETALDQSFPASDPPPWTH